ncbi:unnamed protein product [Ilex paraguariensis]|uniref:Secreted protein n=1 Tax=Ilex paraguariensis TaxID=185542 RepID=A0ABC8TKC7_9AQUA
MASSSFPRLGMSCALNALFWFSRPMMTVSPLYKGGSSLVSIVLPFRSLTQNTPFLICSPEFLFPQPSSTASSLKITVSKPIVDSWSFRCESFSKFFLKNSVSDVFW